MKRAAAGEGNGGGEKNKGSDRSDGSVASLPFQEMITDRQTHQQRKTNRPTIIRK